MPDRVPSVGRWQPSGPVGAAAGRILQLLLLLTIACVFVPLLPSMPRATPDASWQFGLNHAIAQGLAFGRDVVFTYGPYAGIYLKNYHPSADSLMLIGGLYIALVYGLALLLVVRDYRWYLPLILTVVFCGSVYSLWSLYFSYLLLVGLYCFRLAGLRRRPAPRETIILLLLFSALGLMSLVKGSFIALCVAVPLLSCALFLVSRQWFWALIAIGAPVLSLFPFWLLSGQPASSLSAYFLSMAPLISGYSDAMSREGDVGELTVYIAGSACLVIPLLWQGDFTRIQRLFLFILFFVYLFLAFKAGFVRHTGNAASSATSLLLAAMLYASVFHARWSVVVLLVSALVWVYIDRHARHTSVKSIFHDMASVYSQAWTGVKERGRGGSRLDTRYNSRLSELRDRAGFPVFEGTTDIYSYNQSYLIASGNDWHPRPVMQSYAAYTPVLAQKNADHLLGDEAPDNLIFRVEPLDRRIPSSEDGPSWPLILARYRPAALENGFLYLRRESGLPPSSELIEEADRAFGEAVPVPSAYPFVFAEISIRKTLLGRLAGFLFKTGKLQISLRLTDGSSRTFRLVPGMAEAGFLVSPLIESTNQFARLFGQPDRLADRRVRSFSIAPTGSPVFWQDSFAVSLRSVALPPPVDIMPLYRFDGVLEAPETLKVSVARECEGNIDALNGTSPPPEQASATDILTVRGWLAQDPSTGRVPQSVLLVLKGVEGGQTFIGMRRVRHDWAAGKFGMPAMAMSGYTVIADVSAFEGSYELGLAYIEGDRIRVCPQFGVPLQLGVVDR